MKRYLKKLLVCAAVAFGTISAESPTLSIGENSASYARLREASCFNFYGGSGTTTMRMECEERDCIGGCFGGVMGLDIVRGGSERGSKFLAKRLGVNDADSFTIGGAATDSLKAGDFINLSQNALSLAGSPKHPSAKVTFKPEVKRFYWMLCYSHSLSSFYEGLSIGIELPIVYAKYDLNVSYDESQAAVAGTGGTVNGINIKEFFSEGKDGSATPSANQAALKHLVWKNAESKLSLQNIPVWLKLRVVDGENFKAGIGAIAHIPVCNDEYNFATLFEPRVSERNFKTGMNLCLDMCLVEGSDYKVGLDAFGQWMYGWARKGKRAPISTDKPYDHYKLVVSAENLTPTPLVDVLLEKAAIEVRPKHSFDATVCLSAEKGCFVADARYSFHGRSKEENKVEASSALPKMYYVESNAAWNTATVTTATFDASVAAANLKLVETGKFSYNQSSVYNHYLGIGLGCVFKDMQYPASINLSGGYEFGQCSNRNPDMWVVGVKGCICF